MKLPNKKSIGIVGGGQLGRLLAVEAKALGYRVIVLDPTPSCPASEFSDKQIVGDFKEASTIRLLAQEVDYVTFEIELADAEILDCLSKEGKMVNPSAITLQTLKDKYNQKVFLNEHNIPVAQFRAINSTEQAYAFGEEFNYPILLKARFDSYDGRGNCVINNASEVESALEKFKGRQLYCEQFIPFTKELATMAGRGNTDKVVIYPIVETIHKNNICHTVIAPAPIPQEITQDATSLARKVLACLKGWGMFGIEMFLTKDNQILINEIAPRVHNSGHYTIEACNVSQFKQHILAITGADLEEPYLRTPAAVMVNILGNRSGEAQPNGVESARSLPGVSVHIYGKSETRPERKMGHLTALGETREIVLQQASSAREYITI